MPSLLLYPYTSPTLLQQKDVDIINLSTQNSILSQYLAEIRNKDIQTDRLRFRRNIERIGEIMAYEISKTLNYQTKDIQTPLGTATVHVPKDHVVIATILRAGLPFHHGFLNYFDHAENAFVSAFRQYKDPQNFDIHIEYIASPRIDGKTLLLVDPMLATGSSMELSYHAIQTKGTPACIHIASIIASQQAVEHIQKTFPSATTHVWCASIDPAIDNHSYIVPGLGDAGDLAYGEKE